MDKLKCPFCESRSIEPKSGKSICPECGSEFDIDDRLECFFADIEKLRLPAPKASCVLSVVSSKMMKLRLVFTVE